MLKNSIFIVTWSILLFVSEPGWSVNECKHSRERRVSSTRTKHHNHINKQIKRISSLPFSLNSSSPLRITDADMIWWIRLRKTGLLLIKMFQYVSCTWIHSVLFVLCEHASAGNIKLIRTVPFRHTTQLHSHETHKWTFSNTLSVL